MSAVDGLVSGMATSDVIRQLLMLERQPVVRLQAKKTAADKAVTALQGLNTKFSALMDLAKKFKTSGWTTGGVTTSHPANVSVQAAPGTKPTNLSLTVQSLVQTHVSETVSATNKTADAGSAINIRYLDADGAASTYTLTNHDGNLSDIAAKINASATAPVTAEYVFDGTNHRLKLTSKESGAGGAFDADRLVSTNPSNQKITTTSFTTLTAGKDAKVVVGSGDFQQTITSSTNVVEIAEGIQVALKIADPATAITVSVVESSAPASDVEKLVNAANDILKEIKTLTAYDATSKKAGVLQGNSTLRSLQGDVMQAITDAVGGASAGELGLQLNREGTLDFDKAKFDAAYAADPAKVTAILEGTTEVPGVSMRLAAVAETATAYGTGRLTSAIEARRNEIKRLDDTIATWDVRLVRKEARLRKQFAALETALGSFQQQGNWLAGQIASLPKID